MCVATIAWNAHPRWRLIAIGNRDEFHARPAAPLAPWGKRSGIIAGRDLLSGGTWLGVTESRFALVTNLRGYGAPDPDKASRGALVTGMLTGTGPYADPATAQLGEFNPFNLILADSDQAQFLSNRPEDIRITLAHGIYGLSNGALDEPWPKTLQLKGALLDWLLADRLLADWENFSPLFDALRSERFEAAGLHPGRPSDIALEAPETPVFILNPVYGTRCSTVVAIDRQGAGWIAERHFDPHGSMLGETLLEFGWPR